jgi:putative acetyltransferase
MSAFHPLRTCARAASLKSMIIRAERREDVLAIRELVREAFAGAPHSSGTEWAILDALRRADALTISLVAIEGADIVGHVAVSPVTVSATEGWFGLGPVAVRFQQQRQGTGAALIREALDQLRRSGAAGCVVLGEPAYYRKFGFEHDPDITYADVPPPYFQVLDFGSKRPTGPVEYHPAFHVTT